MSLALRLAALILALSVCAPAPASGYPGEWPATSRRAELMRAAAVEFWAARWAGPLPCNGGDDVVVTYAGDLTDTDGGAYGRTYACTPDTPARVWISDSFQRFRAPHPWLARGQYPTFVYYEALTECLVWLHEFGHAFGLEHSATGIMSIDDPAIPQVPAECKRVGRALDPAPAARKSKR